MADEPGVVEVGDHDADVGRHEASLPGTGARPATDEPLRILIITDFYWPYLGGVEQHVRSLCQSLAANGHEVIVATLGRDDLPRFEVDGAVTVQRLRSSTQRFPRLFSSTERPWAPPFPDPAITWQLRRLIARHRPQIVHGHDWLARSYVPLRRWSTRRFGTRFVSSLHYYTLSCARKNLMQATSSAPARGEVPCCGPGPAKCLRCAVRHYGWATGPVTAIGNRVGAAAERRCAAALIAVSAATATGNGLVVDDPAVHVVANFLPPTTAAAPVAAINAFTDLLPSGRFILFVGDVRPMKGVDVLLAAYAGLDTTVPLVLIGKTWPDTPTVLPPGVTVHDRWPNPAVIAAWRASTIAVVPSVWAEPFGIVVIEAMAGASAVIASATGGIPEIVEDGVSGVLVPPGDVSRLRTALADLLADPSRCTALGEAARLRAAAFTAAQVVPAIEAVYRQARSRSTS